MMVVEESTPITTETIYPSRKHNRKPYKELKIQLHGFDLFSPPFPFSINWYFNPPIHPVTGNEVIDKLKCSLAQALELYPPVAGTVHRDADGNSYIAIDEETCLGTPFKSEFRNVPYQHGQYKGISPRIDLQPVPPNSSILEVKVTEFSCGTIAVAASIQHLVVDLHGLIDFVKIWAALTRDEPVDYKSIPSDWNRKPSQFFPAVQGKPTIPSSWALSPSPIPFEKMTERSLTPTVTAGWCISKSSIDQLKADLTSSIKSSNEPDSWISKGDAITSLFAGAFTRARESSSVIRPWGRSSHESQVEIISTPYNARTRRTSGKVESHEYFGNLATAISSISTLRANLLSTTIDAASGVAQAIRNGINEDTTPQMVANYIAYFGDQDVIDLSNCIHYDWDVLITNWCQQDIQSSAFDFGWGNPFLGMCGNVSSMPAGFCVVMNGKKQGDVFVTVGVEQACVKAFNSDPLLNKYATVWYTNEE